MNPKEYKQMMDYLTRSGIKKQIKFASDIARPDPKREVQEIEAVNAFMRRNPINKADGGRIPFAKAKLVKEKYLQTELTKEQKNNIKTWEKNTGQKFSDIPQTSENSTKRNAIKNGRITGARDVQFVYKRDYVPTEADKEVAKKFYGKNFEDLTSEQIKAIAKKKTTGLKGDPSMKFKKAKEILNDPKKLKQFTEFGLKPNVTAKEIIKKYGLSNEEFYNSGLRDLFKDKKFLGLQPETLEKTKESMKKVYNSPTVKKVIKEGKATDADLLKISKQLKTPITETRSKLVQLFDFMDPDGSRSIEGIPKINKTKAANLQTFFMESGLPSDIVDRSIGKSVGEKSLKGMRSRIQNLLGSGDIKGFDVDEAVRRTGSYILGSKPYSIFGQVIDRNVNQNLKRSWDGLSTTLEKKVKEAVANQGDVKGAIENYNNAAKKYEKTFNADTRPGAKKITLPKITDKSPGISVKNKDAYKKYGRFFNNHYENFGYSFEIPKNLKPLPQIQKELSDPKNLAKAEKAMKLGDARIFANPLFSPGILKEAFKSIPTPLGAVALTAGLGVDPTSAIDRASVAAEAAFAPALVKQSAKMGAAQRLFNLGLTPKMAMRAARIASPLGIASLGLEGLYQAGKFTKKRIGELKAMSPEQRRALRARQEAFAFEGAREGGIIGKKSGPPPVSGPTPHGLPYETKGVKKQ